jgi:hypothetical protein
VTLSNSQRRLLKDIARWGELGPDAEDVAGCHGAAFEAVLSALERKGLIAYRTDDATSWWGATLAGCALLAEGASK